jgi:pimeloyl-ACP methyl ester carboxylesterase
MPSVMVNGAELYHEVRGTGPPVLLIMGATGDGGHFDALARVLADDFTVITYDRRGNGRSPVPAGWRTTSPEEQADDAAGLLQVLGTGPVAIFGTSAGGNFALCLLVRHPGWVRGAILHDPVVRPGRRLRRGPSPGAGAGPGGDRGRWAAACGGAFLGLRSRRSGLEPARSGAS